ncbi:uncharacterized protein LOC8275751 [Ricinus communis]|uniref:DUF7138 domain-containing protein n=1 Tax=Ricinus communis TaxID=3988 RepID=B9T2S6_RICCO|nr:uncharacterized protein LOC8275751 [Ricinus communis]EEF29839.1 conserved hypothetical protein [Ricinus communis]|eukprot:XP_002532545.1 uncharacterized protein LOC8275751 [Ricinus communis]
MMSFPAVLFDGEQETSLGNILISPSLNFKVLQSIISEKLVLSPHQFSIYLTDTKKNGMRIPVTGKIDFSTISREKDCIFLVVLKRSRRDRRRKTREVSAAEMLQGRYDPPPANMMLLRRDGNSVAINVDLDRSGFEKRVRELQMEKERYLMNMGLGFEGLSSPQERVVCEECLRAKEVGLEVGFHWCVYDAVTFGFKSPAGPIARPAKGSG